MGISQLESIINGTGWFLYTLFLSENEQIKNYSNGVDSLETVDIYTLLLYNEMKITKERTERKKNKQINTLNTKIHSTNWPEK